MLLTMMALGGISISIVILSYVAQNSLSRLEPDVEAGVYWVAAGLVLAGLLAVFY